MTIEEKIELIKRTLLRGMPGRQIEYQLAADLHQFKITEPSVPSHWLYIDRELLADCKTEDLASLIDIHHVTDTLSKAEQPKKITLKRDGLFEI